MIKISVNNVPYSVQEQSTLDEFLENFDTGDEYAIALNGEFVPRSQYSSTRLKSLDEIDIVSPVGGG